MVECDKQPCVALDSRVDALERRLDQIEATQKIVRDEISSGFKLMHDAITRCYEERGEWSKWFRDKLFPSLIKWAAAITAIAIGGSSLLKALNLLK